MIYKQSTTNIFPLCIRLGASLPVYSSSMYKLTSVILISILFSLSNCSADSEHLNLKGKLLLQKEINYPSGSAIMFHEGKLYLMGDDSQGLLILDTSFNGVDTLPVFGSSTERIFKPIKPDIESSEIINNTLGFSCFCPETLKEKMTRLASKRYFICYDLVIN